MKKILLVEDDKQISEMLHLHFNAPAYHLTSCEKGKQAVVLATTEKYDLIILDIMLPDISGWEVLKQLRMKECGTPVIMLTSLGEEADKVQGLELGADDYITKPFSILELMARTKALLRRTEQSKPEDPDTPEEIRFKDIHIDKVKRKATIRNERLDLTPKEFDLLYLLASNPGKSFSRFELLELIWGFAFEGYEHTVTAHINRLRIKIEPDLSKPEYILTSWGIGYRFSE
ncbi:response regulator [Chitinophaga oryziterrae]|uniref:Phosphate regulon transcriptional regulatory protein PhoB n=1 Tax=Chitinophaga oryziterrae TaxID=1031224 RepID=A0A6N8J4F3_9BACT|nr:response regulator transcription factor [Chitinophaga oryziterrae]MVT39784.1 response regulator [Chitinophaga oryziterrae]